MKCVRNDHFYTHVTRPYERFVPERFHPSTPHHPLQPLQPSSSMHGSAGEMGTPHDWSLAGSQA